MDFHYGYCLDSMMQGTYQPMHVQEDMGMFLNLNQDSLLDNSNHDVMIHVMNPVDSARDHSNLLE
jgi:hypothetical protein